MKLWKRLLVLLTVLALAATACGDDDDGNVTSSDTGEKAAITVGSANFAESTIVASMYAQVLEHAGYEVTEKFDIGARDVYFAALEAGEVDLLPEFVGSITAFLEGETSSDLDDAVGGLEAVLPDGLVALEPAPAQSTNVFVVTAETAEEHGLSKVSDLEGKDDLVLGGPPECPERPFCLIGLQETYGVDLSANFRALDPGGPITKEALDQGEIDVALLFSTDPSIPANDWVILEDDKALQQAENVIPVINEDVLDDEVRELLDAISEKLTDEEYVALVGQVYIDGEDAEDVATAWLEENGFLD